MPNSPVIVSFYAGPGYEAEAREMEATARAVGLFTDVRAVPSLGDWCKNCGMKPAFIRDRMQEYPTRPIVWVDADARIRQFPYLFRTLTCDFAAHWRYGSELLSGTTFWRNSPASRSLCEAWCEAQMRTPDVWDQRVLQRVIDSGHPCKIERLPPSYTRVFDDDKMGDAVIEHMQASRRLSHA